MAAHAQTGTAPAGSGEAGHQSSNMAPPSGNTGAANNGVGTSGSLDHDAGTASSTVAGMGGKAGVGGDSSKSTGGPVESDPALGGGKQRE